MAGAEVVKFVIPKGRSAAEKRIGAIAALHAPKVVDHGVVGRVDLGRELLCSHCSDRFNRAAWPCATVRLLGPWPGEVPDHD